MESAKLANQQQKYGKCSGLVKVMAMHTEEPEPNTRDRTQTKFSNMSWEASGRRDWTPEGSKATAARSGRSISRQQKRRAQSLSPAGGRIAKRSTSSGGSTAAAATS